MSKKVTTQSFIVEATNVHKGKYTYANTVYTKAHDKILITCPVHGDFSQTATDHKSGKGCRECMRVKASNFLKDNPIMERVSLSQFISRATAKHGYLYDYSDVSFVYTKEKVRVGCKVHGTFKVEVTKHLLGVGCAKCAKAATKNGWSSTEWRDIGTSSKNFDSFKVYVIECWNENERFFKIGKTFRSVSRRFKGNSEMPYEYKVVRIVEGSASFISDLEMRMHRANKKHSYLPDVWFNGVNECYSDINIEEY